MVVRGACVQAPIVWVVFARGAYRQITNMIVCLLMNSQRMAWFYSAFFHQAIQIKFKVSVLGMLTDRAQTVIEHQHLSQYSKSAAA